MIRVSDKKKPEEAPKPTAEEIKREEELRKNGSQDIRSVLIEYAKKYNGYPYISASRIERIPEKPEKPSFLLDQLMVNFMARNPASGLQDFKETFASGRLVFIQAHVSCPTLCKDGLYNALDPNGNFIKTLSIGYFALNEGKYDETTDEKSDPLYDYFFFDGNEQYQDLQVNDDVPLAKYYEIHKKLFRRLKKPDFEPIIVVKQGPDQFGMIRGNPFHEISTQEAAALLKNATLTEIPPTPEAPAEKKD